MTMKMTARTFRDEMMVVILAINLTPLMRIMESITAHKRTEKKNRTQ